MPAHQTCTVCVCVLHITLICVYMPGHAFVWLQLHPCDSITTQHSSCVLALRLLSVVMWSFVAGSQDQLVLKSCDGVSPLSYDLLAICTVVSEFWPRLCIAHCSCVRDFNVGTAESHVLWTKNSEMTV